MAASKRKSAAEQSETLAKLGNKTSLGVGRIVQWVDFDEGLLVRLVRAVSISGGSVLFGQTRSRSSWTITVFHDGLPGGKLTTYINDAEEIDGTLKDLGNTWASVAEELTGVDDL